MEFDPQGNLVNSWGDAKVLGNYLHDCLVDKEGNVWIAPARSGFVQKYSHDGKLLLQIGKSGFFDSSDGSAKGKPLNSNAAQFFGPSAVDVDPENGDVYVADGHGGGNTRIAVSDKNGTFLRQWRLYHTEAERNIEVLPHCMRLSDDGLVYVCDRASRSAVASHLAQRVSPRSAPLPDSLSQDETARARIDAQVAIHVAAAMQQLHAQGRFALGAPRNTPQDGCGDHRAA
jgi:DNA-binding beta-propeller fold protein YncE